MCKEDGGGYNNRNVLIKTTKFTTLKSLSSNNNTSSQFLDINCIFTFLPTVKCWKPKRCHNFVITNNREVVILKLGTRQNVNNRHKQTFFQTSFCLFDNIVLPAQAFVILHSIRSSISTNFVWLFETKSFNNCIHYIVLHFYKYCMNFFGDIFAIFHTLLGRASSKIMSSLLTIILF